MGTQRAIQVEPVRARSTVSTAGALAAIRSDRHLGFAAAIAVAVVGGIIAAAWTPRGPSSTDEALACLIGAAAIGLIVGLMLGSRWATLLMPVSFIVGFELARSGTTGPTVDGIHVGTTYGVIALVVGRGITYLLVLGPMVVGGLYGVELAARLHRPGSGRFGRIGWLVMGVASMAVVGLALVIARPASTAPILGSDGGPAPGSITELSSVSLGGHDQALMIRGRSIENPVLLHLAGGPGGTDIGAMRADTGLEEHFIVVTWDQRGTGKSYAALEPVETLTLEQMVTDTIALSESLRGRFDEERIYLHGNSWGSTLGVLAVQRRPDLYHAFVGSGQMVSPRETDIMFYEDTLVWAAGTGDEGLVATLQANGPPPYADILAYEPALSHEKDWNAYPEYDTDLLLPATLFVPENDVMDRVNGLRAFIDTFSVLYPQLQEIDFRRDVPTLDVPVYLVIGAHEARGRAVLADEWFSMLEAPLKERIVFADSGHRPSFEAPAAFVEVMSRVLAETAVLD